MSSIGRQGVEILVNTGGTLSMALAYLLRWNGPVSENDDKYDPVNMNNNLLEDLSPLKHVQGVEYIHARSNGLDNGEIKNAIKNYGGVAVNMYWNSLFVNETTAAYYCNDINKINKEDGHAVCIVGWNDNYDKNNFRTPAPDNGAFIVKNSWGTNHGDNGYYYVSYYDETFARAMTDSGLNGGVGFCFTSVEDYDNYDKNYNYNPLGVTYWDNWTYSNEITYYNQWNASSNDVLKACGVYVNCPAYCDVTVSVNGNSICKRNNILLNYAGFHTITFNPIKITKGQSFRIEVKLHSVDSEDDMKLPIEAWVYDPYIGKFFYQKASANKGESFAYKNGEWVDLPTDKYMANLCLNAFADYDYLKLTTIDASDFTITLGENKKFTMTLSAENGVKLKNAMVTIVIGAGTVVFPTDDNGQISITGLDKVGIDKISMNYAGNEKYAAASKTVTVTVKTPVVVIQTPVNYIVKISSGIKNQASYNYNAKLTLKLSSAVTMSGITIKANSKSLTVKFVNGKCTLDLSKFSLKKNKSYSVIIQGSCLTGNTKYILNKITYTIKTNK